VLVAVGMLEDVEGVAERSESLPVDASGVALFLSMWHCFFYGIAMQFRCAASAVSERPIFE